MSSFESSKQKVRAESARRAARCYYHAIIVLSSNSYALCTL